MANIKKQIAETLKWKKNATYCADKLGITESKYLEIKEELQEAYEGVKEELKRAQQYIRMEEED